MRQFRDLLLGLSASLATIGIAGATDPAGVVSNVIQAQGATGGRVAEHIRLGDTWNVKLETQGESEFFHQDLVVGPGGRTGWHSHPGLLMITVKEGSVDFYDKDCVKHTYAAGQSFTESAEPHNVLNPGSSNTRMLIAYIVKRGEPRRIESAQPPCAVRLQIP
jgi:quercetin dioxygenase-like cupin family protein